MKKLLTVLLSLALVLSLSFGVLAVDYTPSAENKEYENAGVMGEDGQMHDAIVYNSDNSEAYYVDAEIGDTGEFLQLVITPSCRRDLAPVDEITVMINDGEQEIQAAGNIGELAPSMITALQNMKASSTDPAIQALEIGDFAVSALLDVSLLQNGTEIKQIPEGQTIKFRLKTDLKPGDVFFVLVNCDGLGWVLVDSAVIDEDGYVTITVSSLCCMAFVVPGYGTVKLDSNAPLSPRTGNSDLWWLLAAGGVCFAAAAFVAYKKKPEVL